MKFQGRKRLTLHTPIETFAHALYLSRIYRPYRAHFFCFIVLPYLHTSGALSIFNIIMPNNNIYSIPG